MLKKAWGSEEMRSRHKFPRRKMNLEGRLDQSAQISSEDFCMGKIKCETVRR